MRLLCAILFLSGLGACDPGGPAQADVARSEVDQKVPPARQSVDPLQFADYWYTGQGELNSYALTQWRYGEARSGQAVLVFVTEPFSFSRRIKLERPETAGADKLRVLKLNHLRKFPTGVYDYSMMTSVFTPVDRQRFPHTLKLSASSQEWCGQTFLQIDREDENYRLRLFSYFESEGEQERRVKAAMLEDELWTRLRLDPAQFAQGQIVELIPAAHYLRLYHQPLMPRQARIRYEPQERGTWLVVEYLHLPRTLRIRFEEQFPWRILEWREEDDQGLLTTAVLKKSMRLPYWEHHSNDDLPLRDSLGLSCF